MRLSPLVFALLTVLAPALRANPVIVLHESFLASEDLTITIVGDEAHFDGRFVFRSASWVPHHDSDSPATIDVPIWIPARADRGQDALAGFLAAFPADQLTFLNRDNRKWVDAVLGLTMRVAGQPITYMGFTPTASRLPKAWTRRGVLCLYLSEDFDPTPLAEGALVELKYKQPLLHEGKRRVLFYVPILRNVPAERLEQNRSQYRVTIKAPAGVVLKPAKGLQFHTAPTSTELIVFPQHEKPIVVEVEERERVR